MPTAKHVGDWLSPYGSTRKASAIKNVLDADRSDSSALCRPKDGHPYTDTIFRYLRSIECLYCPRPIDQQGEQHYWQFETSPIDSEARTCAVRWIWQTCRDFGFNCHTAFLAVNLFDRYFECKVRMSLSTHFPVSLRMSDPNSDLVVLASLYIAYKHTEVKNYEFWHVLGLNTHRGYIYSRAEVQATESVILQLLGFKLNYYGPKCFIDHLVASIASIREALRDSQEGWEEFVEHSLLTLLHSGDIYTMQASKVAVGMVYLLLQRNAVLDKINWNTQVMPYSLYSEKDACEAARILSAKLPVRSGESNTYQNHLLISTLTASQQF